MATENPIPFNPATLSVSELLDHAKTLERLYNIALQDEDGENLETLALAVYEALEFHNRTKIRAEAV